MVWSHIGSDRRDDWKPGNATLLRPQAEWNGEMRREGKEAIREDEKTFVPRRRDEDEVVAQCLRNVGAERGRKGGGG